VPLENLDTKEYPLAMKPTPPELIQFSYNMPGALETDDEGEDEPTDTQVSLRNCHAILAHNVVMLAINSN
jgi:F-box and WD-40 domain protein CDC4